MSSSTRLQTDPREHQLQQQQQEATTVAVCCGSCHPRWNLFRKKDTIPTESQRRYRRKSFRSSSYVLRSIIKSGGSKDGSVVSLGNANSSIKSSEWDKFSDADSMYFFDAEQDQLGEDDFPASTAVATEDYPILFTNQLPHPAPKVSLEHPETLLRSDTKILSSSHKQQSSVSFAPTPQSKKDRENERKQQQHAKIVARTESAPYEPIESHMNHSQRYLELTRRNSDEFQTHMESPRVKIPLKGYPGDLSVEELGECQAFLRRLKTMDPGISKQIYSMRDVEEQPYTICRWLRATKFKHNEILDRCAENQEMFEIAQSANFYPDVSQAIGAPFSVFLSQYPFLPIGSGRNGCPVNYFQIGKINPEGIMALTTAEQLKGYFWWSFMHKFKQEIRKAQAKDPDFVRIEGINVLDLEGLSASAISQESLDVIQLASKISDFFPETLHCMLILNAPGFFAFSWGLIKKLIDPRTAQRIQVFSSKSKGMAALQQLIAPEQIPVNYGGTNTSIKDAFKEEAHDPTLLRQETQLVHVGRKKSSTDKIRWNLDSDVETIEISIFTRSVSSAKIVVHKNGAAVATIPEAKCKMGYARNANNDNPDPAEETNGGGDDDKMIPKSNSIRLESTLISGPGEITVHVTDLDDVDRKYSSYSRGYFLVVGNVRKKVVQ